MIKLLVVDDFTIDREIMIELLSRFTEYPVEIIGTCENGAAALCFIQDTKPDIVVCDIEMPLMSGIDLAREVIKRKLDIKFIFCSLYDEFEYAREAIFLHSSGYVLKPIDPIELYECLKKCIEEILSKEEQEISFSKIQSFIQSNQLILSTVFFKRLINGDFASESEALEAARYCNIDVANKLYRLLFIEINFSDLTMHSMASADSILESSMSIFNILERLLEAHNPAYIIRTDEIHFLVLLVGSDREELADRLRLYANSVLDEFKLHPHNPLMIISMKTDFSHTDTVCHNFGQLLQANKGLQKQTILDKSESQGQEQERDTENSSSIHMANRCLVLSEQVKQYVKKNIHRNIGLTDVAEDLNYSTNYINTIFKQESGLTISEYILYQKMEKAKALMKDVRNRVYRISEMLGYSHPAYFCNVFKKYTGVTPKQFREKMYDHETV
jgi:YesN/AraC family two-component response regulator